jgi:proteasome lid subunit RPN8/RPN11
LTVVRVRHEVLADVVAHAVDVQPAECCGLLLGRDGSILQAVRAPNVSTSPNRYLLDPATHISVRRDSRARGLEVAGFYHSHPHSAPEPSEADLSEAAYPDSLYLIVSLATEPPGLRLFRFDGERFVRVEIEAGDALTGSRLRRP